VGPRAGLDLWRREKISCLCRELKCGRPTRRYTDRATAVHYPGIITGIPTLDVSVSFIKRVLSVSLNRRGLSKFCSIYCTETFVNRQEVIYIITIFKSKIVCILLHLEYEVAERLDGKTGQETQELTKINNTRSKVMIICVSSSF
jgi:hypothetical protein